MVELLLAAWMQAMVAASGGLAGVAADRSGSDLDGGEGIWRAWRQLEGQQQTEGRRPVQQRP